MKKKKILLVATVQSHICQFHLPLIDMLHKKGYEVHVAAKDNLNQKKGLKLENADKVFNVPFERSPFKKENIEAYRQMKKIIKENGYDIIHCNTPMGGVIARLAGRKYRKNGTKIIYTAHGFHFFKGAKKINWLIYYPIEKYLSKYTDYLITMNEEDYEIAKKKFKHTNVAYTHGVGVKEQKFLFNMTKQQEEDLKKELELQDDDFIIIYVAELTARKNHYMILNIMKELYKEKENIKLLLVGNGPLEGEYKQFIKNNSLEHNVKMLGYRIDVPQLMNISTIAVSTSRQEGLPVNVMEAMITGLPDVVTACRGNRDLIQNNINGYLVEINDIKGMKNKILDLYKDKELRKKMGNNSKKLIKPYLLENVIKELEEIYVNIWRKDEQ